MPRKLNSDLSRFVTCLISSDLYEKRRIDIRIGFFFLTFCCFHASISNWFGLLFFPNVFYPIFHLGS